MVAMVKSSRRRSKVRRELAKATKAAKRRKRRPDAEPPVPPPHPFGWRGSAPAGEPGVPRPAARDPAQDEEGEEGKST